MRDTDRRPPAQQLAEIQFSTLPEVVAELRASGESWRRVERAVWKKSNGVVDVTFETLRRWYGGLA